MPDFQGRRQVKVLDYKGFFMKFANPFFTLLQKKPHEGAFFQVQQRKRKFPSPIAN
jgi:hypothetical protein